MVIVALISQSICNSSNFYTSTQKMSIGATGQVEVSNTVSGNDGAVNIYKASGSNTDKAILRVGYDASAAFEFIE